MVLVYAFVFVAVYLYVLVLVIVALDCFDVFVIFRVVIFCIV